MQHGISILQVFLFFADVSIIFQSQKESFFAARMHWENHFVARFYWQFITGLFVSMITSTTNVRHFGHCKQEKHQIFMQQMTIILNFYKIKYFFFWLDNKNKRPPRTVYLFLRNSTLTPFLNEKSTARCCNTSCNCVSFHWYFCPLFKIIRCLIKI